jgi:hypothetical protein
MGNPRPAGGPRNEEHMNRVAQVPFLTFRSIGSPQHETERRQWKVLCRSEPARHACAEIALNLLGSHESTADRPRAHDRRLP